MDFQLCERDYGESNWSNEKRRQKRRDNMDRVRMVRELSMNEFRHCPGKVTYHPKNELLPRSAFRPGCKQCKLCNALELHRKRNRKLRLDHVFQIDSCSEPKATAASAVDRSPAVVALRVHTFSPLELPPGLATTIATATPRPNAIMPDVAECVHQSVGVRDDDRDWPRLPVDIPTVVALAGDQATMNSTFARDGRCQPRRLTFDDESADANDVREDCHDVAHRSSITSLSIATPTGAPPQLPMTTVTADAFGTNVPHSTFLSSVRLCRWIDWVQSTLMNSLCHVCPPSRSEHSECQDRVVIDVHIAVNLEARVVQTLPSHMWRMAFTTFFRMSSRTSMNDLTQHVLHHMRLSDVDRAAYSMFPFRQAYHASWLKTLMPEQSWHQLSNASLVEHCLFRDRPNRVFVVLKYFPHESDILWRIG